MSEQTLPQFLLTQAREHPRDIAMREKELGIWRQWTWQQYLNEVRDLANGLAALGFQAGDKLAIISDNRPQVYWTMVAVQALHGMPVPLYQDSMSHQLEYVVDHSDAVMVMAENQEQVDKVVDIQNKLSKLRQVIYDDPKGMRHYDDDILISFTEVQAMGRQYAQTHPHDVDEHIAAGTADEVALMGYTSGTTGTPKGAMLSHANLISAVQGMMEVEPYYRTDETLAYLPPAWVGDTFWSLAASLITGCTVNCPEDPSTVQANIREIAPHFLVAPPAIWENLASDIKVRMGDASRLKRLIYDWLAPVGEEVARMRMEGREPQGWLKVKHKVADWCVFGALRDFMGFSRIRSAYTGGAPLGPEVFLFFRGLGINLKQVYGQTETGVTCVQRDNEVLLGTVGTPFPNVQMKLSDDGEVLVSGPTVFLGYYKNEAATADTIRDGWLYSGDAAFFDQNTNHLVVIDRAKDVTALANGTKFAPQFIENKLKFSPYIKEAVAYGQDRDYVATMINIDMENVGKWAERHQVSYTTCADLAQKQEVDELVREEVERVNTDLESAMQIRRYVVLHKELDADDEELTRTRKVRRGFVAQKYTDIISALFSDVDELPVSTVITYQDGRQTTMQTQLRFRSVTTAVSV
jgi:long-chain acyl-CoA synthetase